MNNLSKISICQAGLFLDYMKAKQYSLFKFSIGEDFERFEFSLEHLSAITSNHSVIFETYRYAKTDIKTFLGYHVKQILLSYSSNILAGVTYILQTKKFKEVLTLTYPYFFQSEDKYYGYVKPYTRHKCVTQEGCIIDIILIKRTTVVMLTHTKYGLTYEDVLGKTEVKHFK